MEPVWRACGGRSRINKRQFKELLNIVVNTYECDDTLPPKKNCFLQQFGELFLIKKGIHDRIFLFQKRVKAFGFFSQKRKEKTDPTVKWKIIFHISHCVLVMYLQTDLSSLYITCDSFPCVSHVCVGTQS
jgi:hypothetical protein